MVGEKERLKYLDVIRFFAVCLVLISHFNDSLKTTEITIGGNYYLLKSSYGTLSSGTIGVSLFFIVSGLALYYNYGEKINIKKYIKKRFLSIFPTFWCSYMLVFIYLFTVRKQFWFENSEDISTWKFLLSITGMDGYFKYLGNNFYLIGEWFLGCIIIFYLVFPLLRLIVNKFKGWQIVIPVVILYVLVAIFNPFKVGLTRNLIIRGCDFLFGMLWAKYMMGGRKIDWKIFMISITVFILCIWKNSFFKYPIMALTLVGWSLFVSLVFVFERIDFSEVYIVKTISKYSYEIFLLHHVCINVYLSKFAGHTYSLYEGLILVAGLIIIIYIAVAFEKAVEKELGKIIKGFVLKKNNKIQDNG